MEETDAKIVYTPGLFDDEVIENIRFNIKYIVDEGFGWVEEALSKHDYYRNEMLYCYGLGEDYAMRNPHAKEMVATFTEDQKAFCYEMLEDGGICRAYFLDLLVGLLVNDFLKLSYRYGGIDICKEDYIRELGFDPDLMAWEFRERRNDPFFNEVIDKHKKRCVLCFLSGIRNVFKDELKRRPKTE